METGSIAWIVKMSWKITASTSHHPRVKLIFRFLWYTGELDLLHTWIKMAELSDSELRIELTKLGEKVGPITSTTRSIYHKKLKRIIDRVSVIKWFLGFISNCYTMKWIHSMLKLKSYMFVTSFFTEIVSCMVLYMHMS